jgi:hypothetical protein
MKLSCAYQVQFSLYVFIRTILLFFHQIIEVLEHSGYENLITFAHGDAKPNNFMFRNIEIDLEDLVIRSTITKSNLFSYKALSFFDIGKTTI